MDDFEIEKHLADMGYATYEKEQEKIELEFVSYTDQLYDSRFPIEIDENEMPKSLRSDFTTRSKKRRKILD